MSGASGTSSRQDTLWRFMEESVDETVRLVNGLLQLNKAQRVKLLTEEELVVPCGDIAVLFDEVHQPDGSHVQRALE